MKNMTLPLKTKAIRILMGLFSLLLLITPLYLKFILVEPLTSQRNENDQKITALRDELSKDEVLLAQIKTYQEGLYGLNLLLEARENIASGSDPENPYLVYDQALVLDYLRKLLPEDAQAIKYQINEKGWITMPIESIDYGSLGRVIKAFKNEKSTAFSEVLIPTTVQRTLQQGNDSSAPISSRYSFVLQVKLNPDFWKTAYSYSDVDSTAYYSKAIQDFTAMGLIKGFSDGTFQPEKGMNQKDFITLVLRWLNKKGEMSNDELNHILELLKTDTKNASLILSKELDLATSVDTAFDETLTRAEALKILFTLNPFNQIPKEEMGQDPFNSIPFSDISHDEEFIKIVQKINSIGLLDYLNQTFKPDENVSRAEVVYWLWKLDLNLVSPEQSVNSRQ